MLQKQKIDYLRKRLGALTARVAELENKNALLSKENDFLRNINAENKEYIRDLSNELEDIRSDYNSSLYEMKQMKKKYTEAISSLRILKCKYQKEMKKLLANIKK